MSFASRILCRPSPLLLFPQTLDPFAFEVCDPFGCGPPTAAYVNDFGWITLDVPSIITGWNRVTYDGSGPPILNIQDGVVDPFDLPVPFP